MEYDFYLTLPSNGRKSLELYPDNTVARYRTQLHHAINLEDGFWEVALAEIIFPMSFYNVRKNTFWYKYSVETPEELDLEPMDIANLDGKQNLEYMGNIDREQKLEYIPQGHYSKVEQITTLLNNHHTLGNFMKFHWESLTNTVKPKTFISSDMRFSVEFGDEIKTMLGIENDEEEMVSKKPVNLFSTMPRELYVYCDIVEPQLVGDTAAPLLRIVPVENVEKFGHVNCKIYNSLHYMPVMKKYFDTVEIDILTGTGDLAPFEFGSSIVKVHFRKRSAK